MNDECMLVLSLLFYSFSFLVFEAGLLCVAQAIHQAGLLSAGVKSVHHHCLAGFLLFNNPQSHALPTVGGASCLINIFKIISHRHAQKPP